MRCIEKAAVNSGVSEELTVLVMTHFLESIADEVTKGRAVTIPGFGMFVQVVRRWMGKSLYRPGFLPAVPFRNQVKFGTRPLEDVTLQKRRFCKNHARGGDNGSRTFDVMKTIRDRVTAQLRK